LGDPLAAAETYRSLAERKTELFGADAYDALTAWYGYWNALRDAGRYDEAVDGTPSWRCAVRAL
jgi:hypothetical protein